MSEQIVSSFNIFVDSDRGSPNSTSKGDDYHLNLTGVNLDAEKGQIIRLTVNNFSMYKTFTNVNAHNSKFFLRTKKDNPGNSNSPTNPIGTQLELPHKNHDTIHKIALDFAETLKTQLFIDASNNDSNATKVTLVASTLTPASTAGVAGTSNNVISFKLEFQDGNNGDAPTAHNLTDVKVQFYEKLPDTEDDSDVFSLLGGNRIHKNTDTTTNSITVDSTNDPNAITFTCLYPAQRHTEQFVYLRTNLTSNSLATSSLEAGNHSHDTTNVHHTNILGRFVIDSEVVQYAAGTGREYFIDLPTQRHLNNIRLYLTDHHGRMLSTFAPEQNTLGNLNFNLVLRCDIIQRRAPNEGFTPPVQRTAPARFSNPILQQDGHTRT
jgi:hypothetical protein